MIAPWTIGYTRSGGPESLLAVCAHHDLVVDVRTRPASRVPHWGRSALADLLGARYLWRGADLGGLGAGVQPAGLAWLAEMALSDVSMVLLCACELPGDCHRHRQIAVRLLAEYGIDCLHVVGATGGGFGQGAELVRASDLQTSMDAGAEAEYACWDLGAALTHARRGRWQAEQWL